MANSRIAVGAPRRASNRAPRLLAEELERRTLLATFLVRSPDDVNDGVCDETHCSLREAIEAANASAGADQIEFDIAGPPIPTIRPDAELPAVTDPLAIDGTTQAGGRVEIDGTNAGAGSDGLILVAGNSTVRGLVINRFGARGVVLARNGGNRIEANFIGTDATGTLDQGNGLDGVLVLDTTQNTIGGTTPDARNVISGNGRDGVQMVGNGLRPFAVPPAETLEQAGRVIDPDADSQVILNQRDATITVPGSLHDLSVEIGVVNAPRVLQPVAGDFIAQVTVAGTVEPQGESTSPERLPFNGAGVLVWQDENNYARLERAAFIRDGKLVSAALFELRANGQFVSSNFLGIFPDQPAFLRLIRQGGHLLAIVNQVDSLWNSFSPLAVSFPAAIDVGVAAVNTASSPFTAELREFTVVSGPYSSGSQNRVVGNFIGTDVTGMVDVGNAGNGVAMYGTIGTMLGGVGPAVRNVISGNDSNGVRIDSDAASNVVQSNFVGTDSAGAAAIPNAHYGVVLFQAARFNLIGSAGQRNETVRNVISGNLWSGVGVISARSDENVIGGNFIGTDATGTAALGNLNSGIAIFDGARNNRVTNNVVSGNLWSGVQIAGAGSDRNVVESNVIGTDVTGMQALGNMMHGVAVFNGAAFNNIGLNGSFFSIEKRNVISGNGLSGVLIAQTGVNGVDGNYIGTAADGTTPLGNGSDGITIDAASNNDIGGRLGNVIAANQGNGVQIVGRISSGNSLEGNFIGTDATGVVALGNRLSGVAVNAGFGNRIGGSNSNSPNVIAGNALSGIELDNGARRNEIQGNRIGTDQFGAIDLGNGRDGVLLRNAPGNTIGGSAAGAGNVISGNDWNGISIRGFDVLGGATGWWRADGNADNFISGRAGTTHDGAAFAAGQVRDGFLLDGVDDFVELGTGASVSGFGPFSVEAWISTTGAAGSIVQQRQADTAAGLGFNGEFVLSVGNILGSGGEGRVCWVTFGDLEFGFQFCSNQSVNDGQFHHVVGVREPDGTGRIYIDGMLDNSQAAPPRNLDGSLGVFVGGDVRDNLHFLSGVVDEVLIYERALRGEDVLAIFNAGFAGRGGNVIARNFIGVNGAGTAQLTNAGDGVSISDSPMNTIGGFTGARNIISGNGAAGVNIFGRAAIDSVIQGNFVGTDSSGTVGLGNGSFGIAASSRAQIGGIEQGAGNVVSSNGGAGVAAGAPGSRVQGNLIGTDVTGTRDLGNAGDGVVAGDGSAGVTIGGTTPAARNVIAGNGRNGIHLLGSGHVVQGNYVGTDATGTFAIGNGDGQYYSAGIVLNGADDSQIGGTAPGAGNLISGNIGHGLRIFDTAFRNVVEGNRIGVNVTGLGPLGNQLFGVAVDGGAAMNSIGGTATGAGNVIAFNVNTGVRVADDLGPLSRAIAIQSNAIFSNGDLGIDLSGAGVTDNDSGDRDGGANDRQNFPSLKSVSVRRGQTVVRGSLNSTPNTLFRIEFFENDNLNRAGRAEGQRMLGTITVRTNRRGTAAINASFPGIVAPGHLLTATATDPIGNTSEFSNSVRIRPGRNRAANSSVAAIVAGFRKPEFSIHADR